MEDTKNVTEETKVEDTKIDETKVEDTKVDETKTEETKTEALTLEDVQKMIQSETDKVRTEYSKKLKAEEETKRELELKLMSKDDREKALEQDKETKFQEMEAKLQKMQMEVQTVDLLKTNDLPLDFKDFLIGSSEENTIQNIDAFKKVWNAAIKAEVEGKFKDSGRQITQTGDTPVTKEQFQSMKYQDRVDLFNKDPELYKTLTS